MDDLELRKYLIAGSAIAIYTVVVTAHPEHAGEPPPETPAAPIVGQQATVVSSTPRALTIDVFDPVGVEDQVTTVLRSG